MDRHVGVHRVAVEGLAEHDAPLAVSVDPRSLEVRVHGHDKVTAHPAGRKVELVVGAPDVVAAAGDGVGMAPSSYLVLPGIRCVPTSPMMSNAPISPPLSRRIIAWSAYPLRALRLQRDRAGGQPGPRVDDRATLCPPFPYPRLAEGTMVGEVTRGADFFERRYQGELLRVEAWSPDCIRVRLTLDPEPKPFDWAINPRAKGLDVAVKATDTEVTLRCGKLLVTMSEQEKRGVNGFEAPLSSATRRRGGRCSRSGRPFGSTPTAATSCGRWSPRASAPPRALSRTRPRSSTAWATTSTASSTSRAA